MNVRVSLEDTIAAVAEWNPDPPLRRLRNIGLVTAAVAGVVCVIGAFLATQELLRAYLVAWVYWLSLGLGCLGVAMLGQLSPGGWSIVLRRPMEAGARTIGAMAILFLPILLGVYKLYPWAGGGAEHGAGAHGLAAKAGYLNVPFFAVRAVIYLAAWAGLAAALSRMSRRQDTSADPELARRLRKLSAGGLLVYVATMTLASVDWLMSLEPEWWSTMYGVYVIGGQALSAMALGCVAAVVLADLSEGRLPIRARHVHDSGKMLLALLMLWGYFGLSQLIIIYSANLPEDVPFYVERAHGGFLWMSVALFVLHFAVPFVLLLSRDVKRSRRWLPAIAVLLLAMRWVDVYWLAAPTWSEGELSFHLLDLAAFLAVGGVWVAVYAWQVGTRPLLPLGEPLLGEAIQHG